MNRLFYLIILSGTLFFIFIIFFGDVYKTVKQTFFSEQGGEVLEQELEKTFEQKPMSMPRMNSVIDDNEPFAREKKICLSGNDEALDPEYFKSCLIAAETGDADMQYILATSYAIGLGTDVDKTQAAFWYEKAAEQGHNPAKLVIQLYYDQGIGVERDYILSYAWLSSVEVTSDLPEVALDLIQNKDVIWQRRLNAEQFAEAKKLAKEFRRAYSK